MQEVLDASLHLVNLPYTILLLTVLVYWSAVIVGALDVDLFDGSADVDADAGGFLGFFNPGQVPVMVLVSFGVFIMWIVSMLVTQQFELTSGWVLLALFVPNTLISFTMARYLTSPLRLVFRKLDEDAVDHIAVVGNLCLIRSTEISEFKGQAEVEVSGAHLVINVRTKEGEVVQRGDEAIVVEYLTEEDCYLVVAFDKEN